LLFELRHHVIEIGEVVGEVVHRAINHAVEAEARPPAPPAEFDAIGFDVQFVHHGHVRIELRHCRADGVVHIEFGFEQRVIHADGEIHEDLVEDEAGKLGTQQQNAFHSVNLSDAHRRTT
jgi:hypothetical protein